MDQKKEQILAYGNCGIARFRGKAAYGKDVSPRTGTWFKADGKGELAQHSEALGSVPQVNHGAVHWNNVFLPGEASPRRFRSTRTTEALAVAMRRARRDEESAEVIVVVMQSVSNRRRVTRPVKSAARYDGRRAEPKKRKQPEVFCG